MVGLKTFWITITALIFLSACVPQTKQTRCDGNEAFNATLRSCVPVVPSPENTVNIINPLPSSILSKFKGDGIAMTFSIGVSNPFGVGYSVTWAHIYNGISTPITPGTPTSYSVAPATLSAGVNTGIHVIAVTVKNASNVVIDTHNFQVVITNNPTPYINTWLPTDNTFSLTPLITGQAFSLSIKNNNSVVTSFVTEWKLYKNNVLIDTNNIVFADVTTTGTHTSNYSMNPSVLGVGNYTIRAKLVNTGTSEISDEKMWLVIVAHPDRSKISARNLEKLSATPIYTTTTIAYSGVAYNASNTYNFMPATVTTPAAASNQSDFCVTLTEGGGSYGASGSGVRVNFYLDGTQLVHSAVTSTGSPQVCLSDTLTPSNIVFNTILATHTITARVFDIDSGNVEYLYNSTDMDSGIAGPISWVVNVKSPNAAPTVSFPVAGNTNLSSCATAGTAMTCSVTQDATFRVGVTVSDDFYNSSLFADVSRFAYTMTLSRNGTAISSCTKALTDVLNTTTAPNNHVGPSYYCDFVIPSFDVAGPVTIAGNAYTVAIVVSDSGSPIAGSVAATANTMSYNLSPVIEANTAPVITPQGTTTSDSYLAASTTPSTVINSSATPGHFITEGQTLNINVVVSDAERDHHQVSVYQCGADATCAVGSRSLISIVNVTKNNNALTTNSIVTFAIPENQIPASTPIGVNVAQYFYVSVTDQPDSDDPVLGGLELSDNKIFSVNVRNKNPPPQFGGTPSPALAASLTTMVGYPLTIDPGTVSDASLVSSENVISYQWYVDPTGLGTVGFQKITGANSRILNWTPTNDISVSSTVLLRLCAYDGTPANDLPTDAAAGAVVENATTNGPNCRGNWTVTVKPHAVATAYHNSVGADLDPDIAVWQDTSVPGKRVVYSAYSDGTSIYVEKTVFTSAGVIYNTQAAGFETIKFAAMSSGAPAPNSIKDISITGNDSYIYVAYQAADSGTPGAPRLKVRRIDKRTTNGSKTAFPDTGKFGYAYTKNLPTTAAANVTIGATADGIPYTVNFNGSMTNGEVIAIKAENASVVTTINVLASDAPGANDLCSGLVAGCSTAGNAIKLASIINTSTNRALQGLTAVATGSQVMIYGAVGGENLDSNASFSAFVTGKLGKIMIDNTGSNWYLPFVDNSTTPAGRVRVMSLPTATALDSTAVVSSFVMTDLGIISSFANAFDSVGNQIVVAAINSASIGKMVIYNTAGSAVTLSPTTLFGGAALDAGSMRMSGAVTGNDNYYVVAKVVTATPGVYAWKISRYFSSSLIFVASNLFSSIASGTSLAVLSDDDIVDINIQSYPSLVSSTEARLLVSSLNGGATTNLYAFRYHSDSTLSCDKCVPINYGSQVLSNSGVNKRIGATKIDIDMTIGTAGSAATASENIKDVLFAVYGVDSNSDNIHEPFMSIMNMETESISSTTTNTTGLLQHRPPFIGAN